MRKIKRRVFQKADNSLERMKICLDCPSLKPAYNQCAECGCFMNVKTKMASAKCPLGKW